MRPARVLYDDEAAFITKKIVHECGEYLTPNIPLMLSEAAKYGLYLMLFYQYDEQLPKSMP